MIRLPESKDYLGICDDLCQKLSTLQTAENDSTVSEMLHSIKDIQDRLKFIMDIGDNFSKKDLMIGAFANTMKNVIGTFPNTKGDFDRKYMECPRGMSNLFADGVFGNPIGSDVKFVFSDIDITDMLNFMELLKDSTSRPLSERLTFGPYRLDKVFKVDDVQRTSSPPQSKFCMIMTDVDTGKSIKAFALERMDPVRTRVEGLDYCGAQIYDALPDLIMRRVVLSENLTKYVKKLRESMTRDNRQRIWDTILDVLTKTTQLLNKGYRYIDIGDNKMIKFEIEEKENCIITSITPPYMKVFLACEHTLSLMSLYGIIHEGKSEDTESIVCPMCRKNLIPKLVPALPDKQTVEKFTVKSYKENDMKTEVDTDNFDFEESAVTDVNFKTHENCESYIDGLFKKNEEEVEVENDYASEEAIEMSGSFMNYLAMAMMNQAVNNGQ